MEFKDEQEKNCKLPTGDTSPAAKLLEGLETSCLCTLMIIIFLYAFYCRVIVLFGWRRGVVVSGVRRMNEVNPRQARLVRG